MHNKHVDISHWWSLLGSISYYPVYKSSQCISFEDRVPVDFICRSLTFQWVALAWQANGESRIIGLATTLTSIFPFSFLQTHDLGDRCRQQGWHKYSNCIYFEVSSRIVSYIFHEYIRSNPTTPLWWEFIHVLFIHRHVQWCIMIQINPGLWLNFTYVDRGIIQTSILYTGITKT